MVGEHLYNGWRFEVGHTLVGSVDLIASVMGLKPRFIEYFNSNINTQSDLADFREEIKKLLDKQFSLCVQVTAHAFNFSEFGNIRQDTQDLETRPSPPVFNHLFSPLDYLDGNGADRKHEC